MLQTTLNINALVFYTAVIVNYKISGVTISVSWSLSSHQSLSVYMQAVSGGIVNILGGCSIDYSE
jgi:hypothetical protein